MFKFWSETNPDAKKILEPDLGMRDWNDLTMEEKEKIWHYLEWYFFDKQAREQRGVRLYEFYGEYNEKEYKQKTIHESISYLNETYKAKSFAETYLRSPALNTACHDFHDIFMKQAAVVVMELLSAYANFLYVSTKNDSYIYKEEKETEEDFTQRKIKAEYKYFDRFSRRLNDVFLQFGVKYYLTRDGFMPRQDEKIIKDIYEPVLNYLSDLKWKKVSEILSDAFSDYVKNTAQGYSGCVTKAISAVQAYLQIVVDGKIGSSDGISKLIKQAQEKDLIPIDKFSSEIFKNMDSILMRERGLTGDAHPKQEYANEKNARLVLNLVIIFLQHCIQK